MSFFNLPQGQTSGQLIGKAFGKGLSAGLQEKLQQHTQDQQLKSSAKALTQFMPEEQALAILQAPKEIRETLLSQALFSQMSPQGGQDTEIDVNNESRPAQQQGGISSMSGGQLKQLLNNPLYKNAADAELKERAALTKDVRKSDIKRSDKYLDEVNEERETNARSKSSLATMEQAIEQKDLSFFSADNLKSMAGFGRWISPEGAILNTASKEFFLSDMERIMGRPNQFLEKILSGALPQIGKSNEANQAILEFYKNAIDIQEEKIKITDELEDYYRNSMGYVPGNIGRLVSNQLKPYAQMKEKELTSIFKKAEEKFGKETKGDFVQMTDPSGAVRNVSKKQAKDAQKAGYKLRK